MKFLFEAAEVGLKVSCMCKPLPGLVISMHLQASPLSVTCTVLPLNGSIHSWPLRHHGSSHLYEILYRCFFLRIVMVIVMNKWQPQFLLGEITTYPLAHPLIVSRWLNHFKHAYAMDARSWIGIYELSTSQPLGFETNQVPAWEWSMKRLLYRSTSA